MPGKHSNTLNGLLLSITIGQCTLVGSLAGAVLGLDTRSGGVGWDPEGIDARKVPQNELSLSRLFLGYVREASVGFDDSLQ